MTVGLLHPGQMGESVGRALLNASPDNTVVWVAEGRSADTRARADAAGLEQVGSLDEMSSVADVVFSVCPPASAPDLALEARSAGFVGCFVDLNAVAPDTVRLTAANFGRFVDGGIVGPPVNRPGTTRLYLAGDEAHEVAALFDGSMLDARVVPGGVGSAAALKMADAAWTKGTTALLFNICALAEAEGVADELAAEWQESLPDLSERRDRSAGTVAPRAWRFAGEMDEIAATFWAVGLPGGFHEGSAAVYRELAEFKGRPETGAGSTAIAEIVERLLAARG